MNKDILKYNQLLEESKKDTNYFYRTKSLKGYRRSIMMRMGKGPNTTFPISDFEIDIELYNNMKECDTIFIERYTKKYNISIIKGTIYNTQIGDDDVKLTLKHLDEISIKNPFFSSKRKLEHCFYKEK